MTWEKTGNGKDSANDSRRFGASNPNRIPAVKAIIRGKPSRTLQDNSRATERNHMIARRRLTTVVTLISILIGGCRNQRPSWQVGFTVGVETTLQNGTKAKGGIEIKRTTGTVQGEKK